MNIQFLHDMTSIAAKFVPANQKQAVATMLYELADNAAIRADAAEARLVSIQQQMDRIEQHLSAVKKAEQLEAIAEVMNLPTEVVAEVLDSPAEENTDGQ